MDENSDLRQIQNGFADYYFLDSKGNVFNSKTNKYLKLRKDKVYLLKTTENKQKTISLKKLYYLVFNKIFCIDTIEDLENEIWKVIPDIGNNQYFISNYGRCKSLTGYEAKLLNPFYNQYGYGRITIRSNGERTDVLIHVLVANAFLDRLNQNSDLQIHHRDKNRKNNCVDNLELLTANEHKKKHSKKRRTKENG